MAATATVPDSATVGVGGVPMPVVVQAAPTPKPAPPAVLHPAKNGQDRQGPLHRRPHGASAVTKAKSAAVVRVSYAGDADTLKGTTKHLVSKAKAKAKKKRSRTK